ncbi:MAG: hypothetical protein WCA82_08830, partial [Jiangellales bacterium]
TTLTVEWIHGLGQIVTALLDHGLHITRLVEHDSLPWDALPGQMRSIGGGEYQLADRPWRLPHSYTLQARKSDRTAPADRGTMAGDWRLSTNAMVRADDNGDNAPQADDDTDRVCASTGFS